jgi:hypothetical protein
MFLTEDPSSVDPLEVELVNLIYEKDVLDNDRRQQQELRQIIAEKKRQMTVDATQSRAEQEDKLKRKVK